MSQMTVELLKATLPRALQINATQELADHINNIALDPEVAEEVRNNFLSYTKVLQEGKFKTESYLDAVTYVTHKLMGYSNQDAYIRTFPQRYQTLVAKGMSPKDISAYVAAYHSNKLVNLILEQTVVPSWLLNRDIYQRAINTQFELMTDPDVSAKVRSDAANSILTHLKQPETQKVELDVGLKNAGGIEDLMSSMRQLARQQQELIERGVPARDVARQRLAAEPVDAEFREVVAPAAPSPSSPQPSCPSQAVPSEAAAAAVPGATPASAASPAASAEGKAGGVGERGPAQASGNEAGSLFAPSSPTPATASAGSTTPRVSLFDASILGAGA